ncbi:lantibiotic dehydratase [Pseudovibrio exalbescens]|uniref:lantibiotic dehydratase n=1 Tax=Pseudovibrio exalbescens TaxID=197461 RepID=UPI000C998338|nr:lantibiotic dehydratase [Pseudovibrio exalbescens]
MLDQQSASHQQKAHVRARWQFGPEFVLRSPGFPMEVLELFRMQDTLATLLEMGAEDAKTQQVYSEENQRILDSIGRLLQRQDIRQALFVSSPDVYRNAVPKVERALAKSHFNSDARRALRTVFAYLQRFAAKNETTSFFGALNYGRVDDGWDGWARLETAVDRKKGPGLPMGEDLVTERSVFLTFWALSALAEKIAEEPEFRNALPLHLNPMVILKADGLTMPDQSHRPMPPWAVAVMEAIENGQTRSQIQKTHGPRSQVLIDKLLASSILRHGPIVSSSRLDALEELLAVVSDLPEGSARDRWVGRLTAWQHWCAKMSAASFEERQKLLEEAGLQFETQTGLSAWRGTGAMYEDRTIYYEEALGSIRELTFGRRLHEDLVHRAGPSLQLAAAIGKAQWEALQRSARAVFMRLSPNGTPVPAPRFIDAMKGEVPTMPSVGTNELQCRLEELVSNQSADADGCVRIAPEQLMLKEIEGPRYALLDVFIGAKDMDALASGNYELFVGKMNHHLLLNSWLTTFLPDRDAYSCQLNNRLNEAGLSELTALQVRRRNKGFYSFPGERLVYSDPIGRFDKAEGAKATSLARAEVGLDDGGVVRLMVGGKPIPLYLTLSDHQKYPPFAALALPWLAAPEIDLGQHTPRIYFGDCVIQRQRWSFAAEALNDLTEISGVALLKAAQTFRQTHKLPERVFAKADAERKPIYVDFAVEHCLVMLANLLKRSTAVRFEEMYPDAESLWLTQGGGRYPCELRIHAIYPGAVAKVPETTRAIAGAKLAAGAEIA